MSGSANTMGSDRADERATPVAVERHPTRTCRAILKRLRALGEELPGPDHFYRVRNLRTGPHQRSAGAWSWALYWTGPSPDPTTFGIGGYWPASLCAHPDSTLDRGRFGDSLDPSDAAAKECLRKRRARALSDGSYSQDAADVRAPG